PGRQGDEDPPQVIAIVQPRETAGARRATEAVEGAQRHVLSVSRKPAAPCQLPVRESDEAVEVPLPEGLHGGVVALLEISDPVRDRTFGLSCHVNSPGGGNGTNQYETIHY